MIVGVQKHPERLPGLYRMLPGSYRQGVFLAGVQVVDQEVQVHLLRVHLVGPHRRLVAAYALERDRRTTGRDELDPILIGVVAVDGPAGQRRVEPREGMSVRAIDRDELKAGEGCHPRTLAMITS